MIRLTRGVNLTVDLTTGAVQRGTARGVSLSQVTVKVWVTLQGPCDPASGFVVNVVDINRVITEALQAEKVSQTMVLGLLQWLWALIVKAFPGYSLQRLSADVSENTNVALIAEDTEMVELTLKYQLAAGHRLWNPDWDQQRNFEVFGKCANAKGHGHNYLLELTLRGKPDPRTGQISDVRHIDQAVQEFILDRFDHKNLNEDTKEFAHLNPTVENMTRVFWDLLAGRFAPARLVRVAVWETPNTCAEYFGPGTGPLRYSDCV